jgi:hypothetical protein
MRNHALYIMAAGAMFLELPPAALAQTEQTSDQAYKNIQVLKGVPVSQFLNTMFFQRYALGVSCSYCHVDAQWEKDDKPAKAKAREMERMVLDLNKNVFGGEVKVNCMTCHRGSVKPQTEIVASRISFDQMLGPRRRAVPPAAPPALPSLDSVLARYISALGGRDNLAKITSTATKGNLVTSEGRIVPFEEDFGASPTRWAYVRHFGGSLGDFATGFDGTIAWNKDNRGSITYEGPQRGRWVMIAELANPLALRQLYGDLTVTGIEMVGTSNAVVVAGTARSTASRERLYFDIASGLLVRRSVLSDGLFGSFSSDTYFESYQPIDGVMIPTLVSQFSPDDGTVRKLTSVEHNATLDAARFARPKE